MADLLKLTFRPEANPKESKRDLIPAAEDWSALEKMNRSSAKARKKCNAHLATPDAFESWTYLGSEMLTERESPLCQTTLKTKADLRKKD
ncbi:hypothetical protein HHK36_011658 [Tetracentron sinense]|uniref:Uncharacterized protein n=1 Tax=Tetracentron sinense TaxID=13715 RepID=A0A834Z8P2_TETSI|nr:hypothetical protein HHK36_011658 [Tetracentron sinense]